MAGDWHRWSTSTSHEVRHAIDVKNLLHSGDVTPEEVISLIESSSGADYSSSMHHVVHSVEVHVIRCSRWYIKSARLVAALKKKTEFEVLAEPARKRLSIKVTQAMADEIAAVMKTTSLNKTDLMKSIVLQINEDIIKPKVPRYFEELQTLALVANC